VEEALREVVMQPVHGPFRELANAEMFERIRRTATENKPETLLQELRPKIEKMYEVANEFSGGDGDLRTLCGEMERKLTALVSLTSLTGETAPTRLLRSLLQPESGEPPDVHSSTFVWVTLLGWILVHALGKIVQREGYAQLSRSWIDEWLLGKLLASAYRDFGLSEEQAWRALTLTKILTSRQELQTDKADAVHRILTQLLADREVQAYLQINRYQGVLWYNAESFRELLSGLRIVTAVEVLASAGEDSEGSLRSLADRLRPFDELERADRESGYQIEKLLELSSKPSNRTGKKGRRGSRK
jgi:hypothetical protein